MHHCPSLGIAINKCNYDAANYLVQSIGANHQIANWGQTVLSTLLDSISHMVTRKEANYGSPSLEICKQDAVARILGEHPLFCLPFQPVNCRNYVGWGLRSGQHARQMALRHNAPALLLEDGFLRSFNRLDPPLGIAIDDLGIYYDAHAPSRLEKLIPTRLTAEQEERICAILQQWRQLRLSKYNAGSEYSGPLPDNYVLVVDQVHNDASIRFGMADSAAFQLMLDAACKENPDSIVVVKMHPDIFTKSKSGHFDVRQLQQRQNIMVIAENCLPSRLIENANRIYTVTSQIGFEALIWQKPVRCFGMPFYAGWGLTEDHLPAPERRTKVDFLQLAMAALVFYPRYIDWRIGQACEIERAIDYLAELKQKA